MMIIMFIVFVVHEFRFLRRNKITETAVEESQEVHFANVAIKTQQGVCAEFTLNENCYVSLIVTKLKANNWQFMTFCS